MKRAIPMVFLILFEGVADIFAKKRGDNQYFWYAIAALFFYVVCNVFWLFALKNGSGLGRGSVIFSVASAVLALGLGVFLFKEQISLVQGIGIGLGMLSLVLVSLE